MSGQPPVGGKKGRKFGRNARGKSMAAYHATHRDELNQKRRIARHAAAVKTKHDNPPKVPRGTTRAARRLFMSVEDYLITHKAR